MEKVTRGKNFANSVIVAKLLHWYILNSTGINSASLESNFSIGMQSSVKLFLHVTFPIYGIHQLYYWTGGVYYLWHDQPYIADLILNFSKLPSNV